MTVQEAANYLGLSPRTIYRLVKKSILKSERMGPMHVFRRADLDAYAAAVKGKDKHDPTRYQESEG